METLFKIPAARKVQAKNAEDILKLHEEELNKNVPMGVQPTTTPPTSLFKQYVNTGEDIFKDAAGFALHKLAQTARASVPVAKNLAVQGYQAAKPIVAQTGRNMLSGLKQQLYGPERAEAMFETPVIPRSVFDANVDAPVEPTFNQPETQVAMKSPPIPKGASFTSLPKQQQEAYLDKMAHSIGLNETSIIKEGDRYSSWQDSGVKAYGKAMGKYRVTEAELKAYAPRYLGKKVSAHEFLATPSLQDQYLKNKVRALLQQGYTPQQVADIHNKGMTNAGHPGSTKYQSQHYVDNFNSTFQQ